MTEIKRLIKQKRPNQGCPLDKNEGILVYIMLIQIPKAQNYYLGLSLFHENPKEKLWKF